MECVQVLSRISGVDWNSKDKNLWTPLYISLREGNLEASKILTSLPSINLLVKTHYGDSVANAAVDGGNEECVKLLAKMNCFNWNEKNKIGDTPILTAMRENKTVIVRVLQQIPQVDINVIDIYGNNLIMMAKQRNNKELMKLFEGKVTENQTFKKTISYQELRAKLLGSISESITINVDEFKQQFRKQFGNKTINKRRMERIKNISDLLDELENQLLIFPERRGVCHFLHLVEFIQRNHPSLIKDDLFEEAEQLSMDLQSPKIFPVYFEKGTGKKAMGILLSGGIDSPIGEKKGIFIKEINSEGQAADSKMLKKGLES